MWVKVGNAVYNFDRIVAVNAWDKTCTGGHIEGYIDLFETIGGASCCIKFSSVAERDQEYERVMGLLGVEVDYYEKPTDSSVLF